MRGDEEAWETSPHLVCVCICAWEGGRSHTVLGGTLSRGAGGKGVWICADTKRVPVSFPLFPGLRVTPTPGRRAACFLRTNCSNYQQSVFACAFAVCVHVAR